MKITSFVVVLSLFAAACASNADDAQTAAAGDTSATCSSMQTYDSAVDAAKAALQKSYDAAMDQFNADVKQAQADRDAKLAALPNSDDNADAYNQVITDYNAEVGPKGPIVAKYDAAVKTAQDAWSASVKKALDAYDAHPCYK